MISSNIRDMNSKSLTEVSYNSKRLLAQSLSADLHRKVPPTVWEQVPPGNGNTVAPSSLGMSRKTGAAWFVSTKGIAPGRPWLDKWLQKIKRCLKVFLLMVFLNYLQSVMRGMWRLQPRNQFHTKCCFPSLCNQMFDEYGAAITRWEQVCLFLY